MKKLLKSLKGGKNNQKAIFIDWNGTLSPSNFWIHLEKSTSRKDRDNFKLWADAMFINHEDKIVPWMKGKYASEEILKMIAEDTRSNFDNLFAEFVIGCQKMEYVSSKIPDIIHRLRKKSVFVSIATNNMDCFTRWTVPAMNLRSLFDDILNSFNLRAMKHDLDENGRSLFFRNFFKKHRIIPSNCIFLDDGEDKMGVISSLGINYRRITQENSLEKELLKILQTV